ncbi:MAG: hypothetical protein KAI64_00965, partial [Thermoplasmata archaeon]|nr:hypothetical protein [Thermoplasmata archaeon]
MVAIILISIAIGLYAWIAGIDLMGVLQDFFANPYVYLPLLFLYSFLVAIILPIPIELALLWPLLANDMVLYSVATVVMALGKTTGAWAVFHLGLRIEDDIRKWSK